MERNCSVILLFNTEGKFLVQHRADDAKRSPGLWGFFGGGIEKDETPKQAVLRETKEELEYILTQPLQIQEHTLDDFKKYVFVELYDPSQQLIQHEGQAMRWVTCSELRALSTISHDMEVADLLEKEIESLMIQLKKT
jgi:8-oxo-dGTP diphosphatase